FHPTAGERTALMGNSSENSELRITNYGFNFHPTAGERTALMGNPSLENRKLANLKLANCWKP
ncbi:MAG: hypothetical protein JXA33_00730, partial [Anaerolineae bacterium]|nr:hypothetical protein [Anaerolineae bacterium]